MRTPTQEARLATRLVLSALVAIPAAVAITAAFPTGLRPAVFLTGLAGAGALGLIGGMRARRLIVQGTDRPVRIILSAIVGLTVGLVAGIAIVAATLGAIL